MMNGQLADGIEVNPDISIQVLHNKIAQAAIREAELEAAVQQLLGETNRLRLTMEAMVEAQGGTDADSE